MIRSHTILHACHHFDKGQDLNVLACMAFVEPDEELSDVA